jgi:hypothetical protein
MALAGTGVASMSLKQGRASMALSHGNATLSFSAAKTSIRLSHGYVRISTMPDYVVPFGTAVVVHGKFENADKVLTSPGAVTCRIRKPDGTESTVNASNVGEGRYDASVVPDMAGDWEVRLEGTSPVHVSGEATFRVTGTSFTTAV